MLMIYHVVYILTVNVPFPINVNRKSILFGMSCSRLPDSTFLPFYKRHKYKHVYYSECVCVCVFVSDERLK